MLQQQTMVYSRTTDVFKICTSVVLVLAVSLTIAALFSVYNFAAYDTKDRPLDHNQLVPTFKYFDQNRDANAILAIRRHTYTSGKTEADACSLDSSEAINPAYINGDQIPEPATVFAAKNNQWWQYHSQYTIWNPALPTTAVTKSITVPGVGGAAPVVKTYTAAAYSGQFDLTKAMKDEEW